MFVEFCFAFFQARLGCGAGLFKLIQSGAEAALIRLLGGERHGKLCGPGGEFLVFRRQLQLRGLLAGVFRPGFFSASVAAARAVFFSRSLPSHSFRLLSAAVRALSSSMRTER